MTTRAKTQTGKGAIELCGEAIDLLRMAPFSVTAAYLVGTLPFVLGFLFFWSDMSRSAFAHERLFPSALLLALLFVWMKTFQTVFSSGLRAFIAGRPDSPWTLRRFLRTAAVETILQPYGLLVIPLSILFMLPFPAAYAFYQNLTALNGSPDNTDRTHLVRRAWRQALVDQKQNCILIWFVSPWQLAIALLAAFAAIWLAISISPGVAELQGFFQSLVLILCLFLIYLFILPFSIIGCLVAGNIAAILVLAPWLLHRLFGIETIFTLTGVGAIFNSTFIITVYALSYLCLDPLAKAVYALRCFYGEARSTGADLLVELRALRERKGQP